MLVAGLIAWPGPAAADRYESSCHVQLVGGRAETGDPAATGAGAAPLAGLAVRASYATHNWFQYELAATGLATGQAGFERGRFTLPTGEDVAGPFTVGARALRVDAGVVLRFGVRVVPTARLGLGVQVRHVGQPTVEVDGAARGGVRAARWQVDPVAVAALGLDYRLGPRLIAGAAAGASYAVPTDGTRFRTVEVTAHLAYYWYPLWFQ